MTDIMNYWQSNLIGRHQRLFGATGNPRSARGYPTCGLGWLDLLRRCCVRIESALAEHDRFDIEEIESKYGTLRVGWSGSLPPTIAKKVDYAIELAEARSACCCEICGAEGRLHSRGDWLTTVCPTHASGETVHVSAGCENLYVDRVYDGRSVAIVSCRRYVRAVDSFVDVDPATLDIED